MDVEWLSSPVRALRQLEDAVRADEPDAVHHARTLTRRLRALLAVVPGGAAKRAVDSLARYGHLLGRARDLEVYATRAAALLDELRDTEGAEGARARLVGVTIEERRAAHAAIVEYLDGDDYQELLRRLDRSERRAAEVGRLELLHAARKAARTLRYLGEAADEPGASAAGQRVQDLLGEHRDAVLFARSIEDRDGVYRELRRRALGRADELIRWPDAHDGHAGKPGSVPPTSASRPPSDDGAAS